MIKNFELAVFFFILETIAKDLDIILRRLLLYSILAFDK